MVTSHLPGSHAVILIFTTVAEIQFRLSEAKQHKQPVMQNRIHY